MPLLGNTGLTVSSLCFGTLSLSPLQGFKDSARGAEILRYGLERGINFLDTAEIYTNYDLINKALVGFKGQVVIASKSYAVTGAQMRKSIERARRELNRDCVEVFLLHEQESMFTLKGHWEALEYLVKAKAQGIVRAIGLSTHAVAGVRAGAALPEVDIIHPILNRRGLGIIDGDLNQMLAAIELATQMGKGLYGMKALGGGHLIKQPLKALNFARLVSGVCSVAVGMSSELEVDVNLRIFANEPVPEPWLENLGREQRCLHVAEWCEGCGRCIERCQHGALVLADNRVEVRESDCVLCGYCGAACPHFCLKIIKAGG